MSLKQSQPKSVSSETTREDVKAAFKWATGLIDGDGHIGIEWSNSAKTKWVPLLKVSLHCHNSRAIYKLKQLFQCGKITKSQRMITYRVRSRRHWRDRLLPVWESFPLRSYQHYNMMCVKYALNLTVAKNCCPSAGKTSRGREAVINLKLQLKLNRLVHYPSPIWRLNTALDLDWLAGFVEADGSFYILNNGVHGFAIGQAYDKHIIKAIHAHFHVASSLKEKPTYTMLDTKNKTTLTTISHAMHKRLLGMKSFIFALWRRTLLKKDRLKSLKARQIIHAVRAVNLY